VKDHDSNATDPLDPADPVNRDSVSDSWGRAAAYDAYADGLHTYALGGLRHHEAAASAVYCAFVAADHHVAHLGDAEMLRPWLYAITRHYCRAGKLPRLRLTASAAPAGRRTAPAPKDAAMAELERTLLAAELASLDWPDTDGLSAAHREVLELSVRHGMESRAVGMMLGKPAAESFEVLSQAWHELERSLAALALLRTSRAHCSDLAALAVGWSGRLTAQRREPLVAHVDACSRCQYYLHKVLGAPQAPSILPHVPAPKELREQVLGDLLDSSPEKAAEKAAIAARLARFDPFGFPAIATMRAARPEPPRHRTAAPMPVERRQRRLSALLGGRAAPAAAEAPERLRTPVAASGDAKTPANTTPTTTMPTTTTPANTMYEGSGLRAVAVTADELTDGAFAAPEPALKPAPDTTAGQSTAILAALRAEDTEVLPALRAEDVDASFGPRRDSSIEDTLITARRPGVFDDVRPDRPLPTRRSVPRNSVAAAVEGRRRGVEAVRRGTVPVGDAYEAAATVAAAVAAEDDGGAQVPPIAPLGVMPTAVMPVGMVPGVRSARAFTRPAGAPDPHRRKPTAKSALASSAVLSGVGAAGVTALVLFVPSSPAGNKTLYTPPDPGGSAAQTPDYPRPSSSTDAGPALPVAGSVHSAGVPNGDAVTAQVVAAGLPTTPSSSAPGASSLPFNGPMNPLPSQTSGPSQNPGGDGELHISVSQRSNNPQDVDVTLWNSGTSPLSWSATPDAPWLSLSATSGMLAGGGQTSLHVLVDRSGEPNGAWTAHVRFDPSGQMVSINGVGGPGSGSSSSPSSSPSSGPTTPSTPPTSPSGTPSGTPTSPASSPSTPRSSASSSTGVGGSSSSGSPSGPSSPGSSTSPKATGSGPSSQPSHHKPHH
jgi:DNA-directed RNA polymerase specialized sigma24 family protein